MNRILKNTIVVIFAFISIYSAKAYDFEVDGIYYQTWITWDPINEEQIEYCVVTYGDKKYSGDIIIPEKVVYDSRVYDVKGIGKSAFAYCSLESVTFSNSIEEIDDNAFLYCPLQSINIPNSVTRIGNSAFKYCRKLQSLTIPDSLRYLSQEAFASCTSLEYVKLGGSSSIWNYYDANYFKDCTALKKVIIPGGITKIDCRKVFENCPKLTELSLEYGPEKLDISIKWDNIEKLFIYRELKNSIISYHLQELTIGENAVPLLWETDRYFYLRIITCYRTEPLYYGDGFWPDVYTNAILKVPAEALDTYRSHPIWKNFKNIEPIETSDIEKVVSNETDKVEVGRYDINGRIIDENYHGFVIIRYSDGSCRKAVL